jgi:glucose-6-phosphate dehydrogenase assembly protein OpcA
VTGKYEEISSQSVPSADYRLVEERLTDIWKSAAEGHEGADALTRVSVLNLVVFTQNESIKQKTDALVDAITGHPPLRAIFVETSSGQVVRDYMDANVSVSCRLPTEGEKQLCSEKITLSAGGKGVQKISHGLLPLLEPDLPVFLFWPGEMSIDSDDFNRLAEVCDRLIIDSGDFQDPVLSGLNRWVKAHAADTLLSDLNWARLTLWREWVAEFFDPPPNRRYLPTIDKVVLEVSGGRTTAPYLLLGWLAHVLNWKLADKQEDKIIFQKEGGEEVNARIQTSPSSDDKESALVGLGLESDSPAMKLHVSIQKERACVSWVSESEGSESKCQEMSMKIPDEAQLLSNELQILTRDSVYEGALAHAAELC